MLGDIHGAHRAMLQCFERAGFDYEKDHLIALGDVADGWPETKQCIDELLNVKNLTYVLGNHDFWTLEWMETGYAEEVWFAQGGRATVESYRDGIPESHISFLKKARPYVKLGEKVFVHAGISSRISLENHNMQILLWDRSLAQTAIERLQNKDDRKITNFEAVYIGHTPISGGKPVKANDVWLMDTGAGWSGVLAIMNIDTEEYFTSDPVPELYPGIEGRKRR